MRRVISAQEGKKGLGVEPERKKGHVVIVRPMEVRDVATAHRVMRVAFGRPGSPLRLADHRPEKVVMHRPNEAYFAASESRRADCTRARRAQLLTARARSLSRGRTSRNTTIDSVPKTRAAAAQRVA